MNNYTQRMKKAKIRLNSRIKWIVPLILALLIVVVQFFPLWIEKVYSTHWYVSLSRILRVLIGWIPFSFGDILYILTGILIFEGFLKETVLLIRKQCSWHRLGKKLQHLIRVLLWLYIWFNLTWGLNYSRLGIAYQLQLHRLEYNKRDITQLTGQLIQKLNECRRQLKDSVLPQPPLPSIFTEAIRCYQSVAKENPFLTYRNPSVKASLYSSLGNYFGFTGYYNPFTGEAQVRSDVPKVLLPFIVCHEMAHQLGYASESEANFVGYLAASSSSDVYFRYSVYMDLFSYAQGEEIRMYLMDNDTTGLKATLSQNRNTLDTLVKNDRREIREFFYKRENKISPVISGIYDQYLKMNKQEAGIKSYDEVIGWVLAYQKRKNSI
jgi:hypothetical protein